jgi:hypothetical protein
MTYSVYGRPVNFINLVHLPAAPEDRQQMATWMPTITELVSFLARSERVLDSQAHLGARWQG